MIGMFVFGIWIERHPIVAEDAFHNSACISSTLKNFPLVLLA
jgi:hypothetical protein